MIYIFYPWFELAKKKSSSNGCCWKDLAVGTKQETMSFEILFILFPKLAKGVRVPRK